MSTKMYRWAVASRAAAAIAGGYALSAAVAAGLALLLHGAGMMRAEAVLASTMLAFVAHACAALWAFGCRSAWRAWAGVFVPTILFGAVVWLAPVAGEQGAVPAAMSSGGARR